MDGIELKTTIGKDFLLQKMNCPYVLTIAIKKAWLLCKVGEKFLE
jgi:hypothetical protein